MSRASSTEARRARNTHRVAITNSRLVRIEGEQVPSRGSLCRFRPAARDDGRGVLRRFLLHMLPNRFVRIRYYGLLANRHREKALALCRQVLPGRPAQKIPKTDWRHRLENLTGIDPSRCEVCGQKALRLIEALVPARAPRAPPAWILSSYIDFHIYLLIRGGRELCVLTGTAVYSERRNRGLGDQTCG